jgi:hypothetical protein
MPVNFGICGDVLCATPIFLNADHHRVKFAGTCP